MLNTYKKIFGTFQGFDIHLAENIGPMCTYFTNRELALSLYFVHNFQTLYLWNNISIADLKHQTAYVKRMS